MKLHEAMKAILKKAGYKVLDDKRFLSFLADYRAYDDYPAMKQVMKALADGGYTRELSCRIKNKNDRDTRLYAAYLKRALSDAYDFKQEFASYAADSIAYALELTDSVNEPADHGYDAVDHNASHGDGSDWLDEGQPISQGNSSVQFYLQKKADQGDAEAQKILGDIYFDGEIVGQGPVQALNWYRKAADQGNPDAQYCLGHIYMSWQYIMPDESSDSWEDKISEAEAEAEGEKWYLKAAEQGNADAMFWLGFEYGSKARIAEQNILDKTGKPSDYAQKSAMWYKKAVDRLLMLSGQGNANAMCRLGLMYRLGYGVKNDSSEAEKWFTKAASLGNAQAEANLGDMYRSGDGVERNCITAVKWYIEAAGNGSVSAQVALGDMYKNGDGVTCDYLNAVKWYKKAAGQNNCDALFNLGSMYRYGWGVRQDYDEAAKCYVRAALKGDDRSQYELGELYQDEIWPSHDLNEALKWYRKAADEGNGAAQYRIGSMYENGKGVGRNIDEALTWYGMAAENENKEAQKRLDQLCLVAAQRGDAKAQYKLGEKYYSGDGIEEDDGLAAKWYRKAAEQGNAAAQYRLGYMYQGGLGVAQNYAEAVMWYRKSAEQANKDAMLSLSTMYEHGWGVEKDSAEAKKWLDRYLE